MSETAIKHEFMLRLRSMINYVKRNDGIIKHYCPASILLTKRFTDPANKILADEYCLTCREVMGMFDTDECPCGYYGVEALKEAKKRIHKYFNNEEK